MNLVETSLQLTYLICLIYLHIKNEVEVVVSFTFVNS